MVSQYIVLIIQKKTCKLQGRLQREVVKEKKQDSLLLTNYQMTENEIETECEMPGKETQEKITEM